MKSEHQIRGISRPPSFSAIVGTTSWNILIKAGHLSGKSQVYLAPENKVAEKLSAPSAGFLCTTKIGVVPTNRILIYPSLILGRKPMSTSCPLAPTMYCQQKSRKSPSKRNSTWLSTASVHLILVSRGRAYPGTTFSASTTDTLHIPEPVEPLFCFRTLYPRVRVTGKVFLKVSMSQYPYVSSGTIEVPASFTRASFAPYLVMTSGLVRPTSPQADSFLSRSKNFSSPPGMVPGLTLGMQATYPSLVTQSYSFSAHQSLQKMMSHWRPSVLLIAVLMGTESFLWPSKPLSLPPSASKRTTFLT